MSGNNRKALWKEVEMFVFILALKDEAEKATWETPSDTWEH